MTTLQKIISLIAVLILTFGSAAFGAQFMPGDWYAALQKPPLTPPNNVFGPVWTVLYALMSVAAWLVWQRTTWAGQRPAMALYLFQLALNAIWSYLFFGLHSPGIALIEIGLLWGMIIATTVLFFRANSSAGFLMVPYLAWVTFAAYLNAGLWWLNR
jgi:translocator protein